MARGMVIYLRNLLLIDSLSFSLIVTVRQGFSEHSCTDILINFVYISKRSFLFMGLVAQRLHTFLISKHCQTIIPKDDNSLPKCEDASFPHAFNHHYYNKQCNFANLVSEEWSCLCFSSCFINYEWNRAFLIYYWPINLLIFLPIFQVSHMFSLIDLKKIFKIAESCISSMISQSSSYIAIFQLWFYCHCVYVSKCILYSIRIWDPH